MQLKGGGHIKLMLIFGEMFSWIVLKLKISCLKFIKLAKNCILMVSSVLGNTLQVDHTTKRNSTDSDKSL